MDQIELDSTNIPEHIAIIMDGNGRWAKARGQERSFGHVQGVETVRKITMEAVRLGVKHLTLYTFSTENWNRPPKEIQALMGLILDSLEDEIFIKNNVRFRTIGDIKRLPKDVQTRLSECEERTKENTKMTFIIALSYSSRWEITETVKEITKDAIEGSIKPEDITDELISGKLCTNFMPDPDLLIRTGGEQRLSNFLLWQCAYTEFYFCDTYWPDFDEKELQKAINYFQQRERRFGKTSEQVTL